MILTTTKIMIKTEMRKRKTFDTHTHTRTPIGLKSKTKAISLVVWHRKRKALWIREEKRREMFEQQKRTKLKELVRIVRTTVCVCVCRRIIDEFRLPSFLVFFFFRHFSEERLRTEFFSSVFFSLNLSSSSMIFVYLIFGFGCFCA